MCKTAQRAARRERSLSRPKSTRRRSIPAFTAAGYRCITYDRRGWGRSRPDLTGEQPTDATVPTFVAEALRDEYGTALFLLALLMGTLILFMAPGALLARWLLYEYFSGVALLPAAFVSSVGVFALLGVPALVFQSSLQTYLWISGATVALFLLAATLAVFFGTLRRESTSSNGTDFVVSDRGGLLWLPFLALVAALGYITRICAPSSSNIPTRMLWAAVSA
jgi:pimeloyl-ACP methyl ester carboxylesterase